MKFPILWLVVLFISGCLSTYSFKSLSSFNLDHDALEDGDTIKVLYSSGGPDDNRDREYLYHLIVTSVDEKDTFNLLTPDISNLGQENNIKTFISSEGAAYKVLLLSDEDKQKMAAHIDELKTDPIERVISNRDFPGADNNKYPAVIGMLGELMSTLPNDVQEVIQRQINEQKSDATEVKTDSF